MILDTTAPPEDVVKIKYRSADMGHCYIKE